MPWRVDTMNYTSLRSEHKRLVYAMVKHTHPGFAAGESFPVVTTMEEAELLYIEAREFRRSCGWFVWEDDWVEPEVPDTQDYHAEPATQQR